MPAQFHLPIRVYYEDTDAGGVVYHANYLRFAERARTEWLRYMRAEHTKMAEKDGLYWVVRSAQCEYFRPAKLDDLLIVGATVLERKKASITLEQTVMRDDTLLATVVVRLACVDATGRPRPIPPIE